MGITKHNEKKQYALYGDSRKETESIFKAIMAVNFPNLQREMGIQIHEAKRSPNRLNLNRAILRRITIKLPKVEDKELYEQQRKKISYVPP